MSGMWADYKQVSGVFSQAESVKDLEENIKDAYRMMELQDQGWHRLQAQR